MIQQRHSMQLLAPYYIPAWIILNVSYTCDRTAYDLNRMTENICM